MVDVSCRNPNTLHHLSGEADGKGDRQEKWKFEHWSEAWSDGAFDSITHKQGNMRGNTFDGT